MSFTPNMPQSGQTLGQTRLPFLNNFFTLRSSQSTIPYGVGDHADVNNGQLPPGRHRWVRMPDVGADLPPAVANLFTFYVKGTPDSQIFYRTPASTDVQFSNDFFHITGPSPTVYDAYTVPIIGGLMLKVGQVKVATNTNTTFSFATVTGSDFATNVLFYKAGRFNSGAVSTTQFEVLNQFIDKDTWYTFIAIGI